MIEWYRVQAKQHGKSNILEYKSKDKDKEYFLVKFSSSNALRTIEKKEGIPHWCYPQFMKTHEICSESSI